MHVFIYCARQPGNSCFSNLGFFIYCVGNFQFLENYYSDFVLPNCKFSNFTSLLFSNQKFIFALFLEVFFQVCLPHHSFVLLILVFKFNCQEHFLFSKYSFFLLYSALVLGVEYHPTYVSVNWCWC